MIFIFQYGQITPALGMKILLQFDKSVNNSLATRVKSKITFKVNHLCQKYLKLSHIIFKWYIKDVYYKTVKKKYTRWISGHSKQHH